MDISKSYRLFCCFCFITVFLQAQSQTDAVADTAFLPLVLIKSASIQEQLQKIPSAVSLLNKEELNRGAPELLTASFNRKPGIYTQEGALNMSRITIRGIGARAQYGTNRVKAYFNEIPISSGDGESVINDIDLEAVERVEITKGPNSGLYGSGLGGVIHLFAGESKLNQSFAKTAVDFGSFGLLKRTVTIGHGDFSKNLFATYNHLQSDGFRENSGYDRKSFVFNGKINSGANSSFSFLGSFVRLKAFIPSSISETDFMNNPEIAASNWKQAQGFESYDRLLAGLAYTGKISEKIRNTTSLFVNYRDAYEPRPFDILKQQSFGIGARTRFNYENEFFGLPLKISLGGEFLNERYDGSNFENLYTDFPGQGSVRGALFANVEQDRNYYNAFGQMNFEVSRKLKFTGGININTTDYSLTNLFAENSTEQEGKYRFKTVWSPRFAVLYQVSENKNLYANISKGFSVPTVDETLTPEGSINTNLRPETGWNYEIGFKGSWIPGLYTEIALYSIRVSDLLVARRVAEDQYVGINAGRTNHDGVEVLVNYQWKAFSSVSVNPYFSASFHRFRFDDFVDEGNDYSGNELTGVPGKTINFGIDIATDKGFSVYGNFMYVSEIPLNDANSKYTESYSLVDLKAVYTFHLFTHLETRLTVGVNNLFNERYAVSILPNAIGFGGSEPRYYYPGNPRNYYAGAAVRYVF